MIEQRGSRKKIGAQSAPYRSARSRGRRTRADRSAIARREEAGAKRGVGAPLRLGAWGNGAPGGTRQSKATAARPQAAMTLTPMKSGHGAASPVRPTGPSAGVFKGARPPCQCWLAANFPRTAPAHEWRGLGR